MKKLLIASGALLLMIASLYFITVMNAEGTFDVACFIEENEVEMCFDDSQWHYDYWLERKQGVVG